MATSEPGSATGTKAVCGFSGVREERALVPRLSDASVRKLSGRESCVVTESRNTLTTQRRRLEHLCLGHGKDGFRTVHQPVGGVQISGQYSFRTDTGDDETVSTFVKKWRRPLIRNCSVGRLQDERVRLV